ncbi:MAG: biopolymer transporter ExbB [Amylibacter sp.]|jgi:hypothetical protein|nr:biopolymer transporter ExbB [Amylibacter sp.]MDB2600068.1 biopolymer transporter ExbB [Amylibacter sp.]MDG1947602.1 biopolymer transporter ExbB [Amylibacter sp.]RZO42239.1 MAG: biopolymer transporter ExbB [Paracoccaceae bacterium]|tara:strand:- start:335 stop:1477 length:1143 start_codon:yes stop_codon:yes gene_type:complete
MAQKDLGFQNQFTQPVNQIITMLLIVIAVFVGGYFLYPAVSPIFVASPYLNGFIFIVFLGGLVSCFGQVVSLVKSVSWIEGFVIDRVGHDLIKPPGLMASLAALLSDSGARHALTSTSTRSILDSAATRLDEGREITRYIINLLIFLGLLGTFYGLATTVPAVVDTIRSLAPQEGSTGLDVFAKLMTGLEAQLGGMGTAFGSSLLGLAGSLVVGILDLFAGRGQNRFYRELEEWLSSITKITIGGDSVGDSDLAGAGLFQHANANMENMNSLFAQTAGRMDQLAVSIEHMVQHTASLHDVNNLAFQSIAQGQQNLVDAVMKMQEDGDGILDAETRMRLKNIDTQLLRILEETSTGRNESTQELRQNINALTSAINNLATK